MAAAKFKQGDHVMADFGGGGGAQVSHVLSGPHENGEGETKWTIQKPDGGHAELTHTEPKDRVNDVTGVTFWSI